ncbi:MAG: hypothetical protein ABJG55_14275, partial [Paracoccaceae bacterium]
MFDQRELGFDDRTPWNFVDRGQRNFIRAFKSKVLQGSETPQCHDVNVLRQKGLTGTGWALAWKAKSWARLGEGKIAHSHLHALLSPVLATQV